MKNVRKLYLLSLLISLLGVAPAQLRIDATGPIRHRKREPTIGSGGRVGRKLSLRVDASIPNPSPDAEGRTIVEFTLTNASNEQIMIPTSPHPGDLEPPDAQAVYTEWTLGLLINLVQDAKTQVLPGGAVLFGNVEHTGSLVALAPGKSIRVLARVLLPRDPPEGARFVAYAGLDTETISTKLGHTSSAGSEIGSATSQEYTLHELIGRVSH
jgi:hypothetical protein